LQAEVAIGPLVPAIFWFGLSLGRWGGSIFLRRYPERSVFHSGLAVGSAGIVMLLSSTSLASAFSGELITGIGFATIYPITIARFSRHYGLLARRLGVIMFSMGAIGPAVVPWMVGIVSSQTGSLRSGLVLPLVAIAIIWSIDILH
jgi:fucose permease